MNDLMESKISMIVDYYVINMLDEPDIIRDALADYFSKQKDKEIQALFNDLFEGVEND